MLSLFPQLFNYQELAPLILRIVAGLIAASFAYPKLKRLAEWKNFLIGSGEILIGIFLISGFFIQIAAGLMILAVLFEASQKIFPETTN